MIDSVIGASPSLAHENNNAHAGAILSIDDFIPTFLQLISVKHNARARIKQEIQYTLY